MADYRKMRRADREITDFGKILDVLRRADTIRLGLNGDPYPYVVPLSFGFEALNGGSYGEIGGGAADSSGGSENYGRIASNPDNKEDGENAGAGAVALYVHGAAVGYKHELIARDNHVCVEADIFHRYVKYGEGDASSVTTEFESVIGFGTVAAVTGAEAVRGVRLLLEHCGFPDFEYDEEAALNTITVYKITLTHITGKRRFI